MPAERTTSFHKDILLLDSQKGNTTDMDGMESQTGTEYNIRVLKRSKTYQCTHTHTHTHSKHV